MLRVYFDSPPDDTGVFAWALFDARENVVREGRDKPDHWPTTKIREAVLDISLVTCLALELPPMNAARRDSAIRLALEDKLVTPIAQQHIVAESLSDGGVLVRIIDQALLNALRKLGFSRVITETDLVPSTAKSWHCCCAENRKGFVRRDDGGAFAVEISADAPPPELLLALKQTASTPKPCRQPTMLRLNTPEAERLRAQWQSALPASASLNIAPGKVWQWSRAPSEKFTQAANLLPVENAATPNAPIHPRWHLALKLAALALALHIVLTFSAWGAAFWQHWQIERGWQALAQDVGLSYNRATIQQDWARVYAQMRHKAGLAAPNDALPLLAQAAPAFSLLPENPLRRAVYADAAWTIEWQAADTQYRANIEAALRQAGLSIMSGGDADTYRLRIQAQGGAP